MNNNNKRKMRRCVELKISFNRNVELRRKDSQKLNIRDWKNLYVWSKKKFCVKKGRKFCDLSKKKLIV